MGKSLGCSSKSDEKVAKLSGALDRSAWVWPYDPGVQEARCTLGSEMVPRPNRIAMAASGSGFMTNKSTIERQHFWSSTLFTTYVIMCYHMLTYLPHMQCIERKRFLIWFTTLWSSCVAMTGGVRKYPGPSCIPMAWPNSVFMGSK